MVKYIVREYDPLPSDDTGGVFGWFNHYAGNNIFNALKSYFDALEIWNGFEYAVEIELKKDFGNGVDAKGGKRMKKRMRYWRTHPVKHPIKKCEFSPIEKDELPF